MRHRHAVLNSAGSVHFVTTVTSVRGTWFTDTDTCQQMLEAFERYRASTGILCFGYVLMPDHLHALLFQQVEDGGVIRLMNGFKGGSSRLLRPADYPDRKLWRRYLDDVPIPGSGALRTRLAYMHENPVRQGIARAAEDYPWSSAGLYADNKASTVQVTQLDALGGYSA